MARAPKVYYCDTDGFAVPDGLKYETSNELGGLKHEYHIFEGDFHAPKTYRIHTDKVDKKTGRPVGWTVKAKGFSRIINRLTGETERISYDHFTKLLEHKELPVEQFSRVKGLLKSGNLNPHDIERTKAFRDQVTPKRYFPKGQAESRPWTVEELESMIPRKAS
jgi:hypothetical protein